MGWKKAGRGIRFKEHPERKNGIKPDRYFSIYFRTGGKQIEQGLGWGTEGMTVEKAMSILNELKNNQPVIGKLRLLDIAPIHLERIKLNMGKKELSARTIHYCLAVCRQVFNYGRKQDHFHGDNPVSKVKKPVANNRRMRFLSHEEAQMLLDEIKIHSVLTYRITLISLHCGLRFGEIAGLTWRDLNFQNDTILIRNPKNGQTRVTFMSEAVKVMFLEMEHAAIHSLHGRLPMVWTYSQYAN